MNKIAVFASICLAFVLVGCASVQDTIAQKEKGVFLIVNEIQNPVDQAKGTAIGTGFFIGENEILTNAHVVANTKGLHVKLENSKPYDAEVVFVDPGIDLALIKIKDWNSFKKENSITILTFADANDIKVMDEVFALGNPWGLTFSISKGIISNPLRRLDVVPKFMVQTDAHVYNGNSGGPLLNDEGEVLGVNSLMMAQEGGSYGFALRSDIIKKVLADWKSKGEVKWATVGVRLNDNTEIAEVISGTPAALAGLKSGDFIKGMVTPDKTYSFDDAMSVTLYFALLEEKTVELIIERDGKEIKIDVTPLYKTSKEIAQ